MIPDDLTYIEHNTAALVEQGESNSEQLARLVNALEAIARILALSALLTLPGGVSEQPLDALREELNRLS